MKIKILEYYAGSTPVFERYTSPIKVPCYDDITQLWVLKNDVYDKFLVMINDVEYWIYILAKTGLITDKASTPCESSDWYAAAPFYLHHDINFSCHYLDQFAENNDDGFRAANLLFRESINWKIKESVKLKKISRFRAFFWHIKKRIWWRSVGSIIGQSLYVNGSPERGYHGEFSACRIERVGE